MKSIQQIAKMAEDSNEALCHALKDCNRTIDSHKGKMKTSAYHLAVKIKKMVEAQIVENTATLKSLGRS